MKSLTYLGVHKTITGEPLAAKPLLAALLARKHY